MKDLKRASWLGRHIGRTAKDRRDNFVGAKLGKFLVQKPEWDWNGKADEDAERNNLGERPISIEAVQNKPKDLPRNGRREHTKCSPVLPMRSRYC